jgi:hypothetical protein
MTEFEFTVEKNKELRNWLVELEKKCKELIKKIDSEGLGIYHSINSDIFEMSTRIYKISAVLGLIKTFHLELDNLDKEQK